MLHALLKAEGLVVNRKKTYRLYTEERLQVRTKRRKKLARPRVPLAIPDRANERWSMDFVSDQLASGRRFRVLNIVDDYTRECVGQLTDTSISGQRVAAYLQQLGETRGLPKGMSATTARSSPARRCSCGRAKAASSCISSSQASRCRTRSWKASMASSGTTA